MDPSLVTYYRQRLKQRVSDLLDLRAAWLLHARQTQDLLRILNTLLKAQDYPEIVTQAQMALKQLESNEENSGAALAALIQALEQSSDLQQKEATQVILAHLQQGLNLIRSSAKEKNLDELNLLAHSLAGSGTTYGFPDISAAASLLEHCSETEKPKYLAHLLQILEQYLEEEMPSPAILVVQKDPELALLMQHALQTEGYQVMGVENAEQAWPILLRQNIRLLITDWVLPDMDGRRFIQEVRARVESPPAVMLLISSVWLPAITADNIEVESLLIKPFLPQELVAEVQKYLSTEALEQRQVVLPLQTNQVNVSDLKRLPHILLADDDPLIASIIRFRLSQMGYQVEHVAEGDEVISTLVSDTFDLLILDLKMPGHDGFHILENLRQMPEFKSLPVLILTRLGNEEHLIRGFQLGANDYMTKPFSPDELVSRIQRLLL